MFRRQGDQKIGISKLEKAVRRGDAGTRLHQKEAAQRLRRTDREGFWKEFIFPKKED